MGNSELVKKFVEAYQRSVNDPVEFAWRFLGFDAFPYQEEFLRDESAQIAACCGRQVGKSTLAAVKALHFALSRPGVRILIVSASHRQSMLLFDKIQDCVGDAVAARALREYGSRTKLKFGNGSEIVALPCGRYGATLRGFTADMVILDEANFVPEEVVDGVVRPMLITRPDARLIMMSTPWRSDHPFYRAVSEKRAGLSIYTWPTRLNPLVPREKLEADRRLMDDGRFRREYEAQFVLGEDCYFPADMIDQCIDHDLELLEDHEVMGQDFKGSYHLGVDFGKHVDHSVIAILQRNRDRALRLVYLKEFPLGTPYASVTGWIRRLNTRFHFSSVTLDETGVGGGPVEDVRGFVPRAEGVTLSTKIKQDVLSNMLVIMQHGRLAIPFEQELITQISSQRYEMGKSGQTLFSHPGRSHDDQLWALALAAWGASTAIARPSFKPITRSF